MEHSACLTYEKYWNTVICHGFLVVYQRVYHGCIITNITMENHHFEWENSLFLWPLSMATWNYQRVPKKNHGLRIIIFFHFILLDTEVRSTNWDVHPREFDGLTCRKWCGLKFTWMRVFSTPNDQMGTCFLLHVLHVLQVLHVLHVLHVVHVVHVLGWVDWVDNQISYVTQPLEYIKKTYIKIH